ncbi:MAG TPA: hypothetical protein GX739_07700 [Firmicutes bacterium]|nr:hypothetical protein [Bacillota bacterium]
MINHQLSYQGRCLRILTGKLLLGPTGKRLFADYLDKEPGFSGRINFIHTINLTGLFRVRCSAVTDYEEAETTWYPSMLTMKLETPRVSFAETKFITWDDCAVSCQSWTNKTAKPIELTLEAEAALCESGIDERSGSLTLVSPQTEHGFAVGASVRSNMGLERGSYILMPGESVEFVVAAAVGNLEVEDLDSIVQRSIDFFADGVDYISRHNDEYESFFRDIPRFESSDQVLNKTWYYRWFVLRHNLAQPDYGFLQGMVMYEGRSHKKSKRPLSSGGWHFSKLINLSTPLQLTDMRWHINRKIVYDMIRNMVDNLEENGLFCCAYVDRRLHSFANYGVWAIYQFYLVDRNKEFIKEILPRLKDVVKNETRVYSRDDHLQIEVKPSRTGKEYQPSYWYWHDYPPNPKAPGNYTPLKRVDRSVYHYKNVLGVARLCQALADPDYLDFEQEAENIKRDILSKMWDPETEFFYDLHFETDAKAMVKNIVGIYPHWAAITGEEHLGALKKLFDPDYFHTACPFPSVARDCKAYRPEGGWMGRFIKGRNGCVWCGPSWPYTTSVAIDAIGIESKRSNHSFDKEFAHYLREYSLQHYRGRDLMKPYLVEHYHGETGEPLSDEPDYNHSFYIDLIMSHVAGITFAEDGVRFDPIDVGLDFFVLDQVQIGDDVYRITYKIPDCSDPRVSELEDGYNVYKNGVKIAL